jgi:hypothetical protein
VRQHHLNVSGIRVHVRAKAIDGFLLVDLIGSLNLTARLDWEFAQNRSQVLGREPSPSKLSFQQKTGHPLTRIETEMLRSSARTDDAL